MAMIVSSARPDSTGRRTSAVSGGTAANVRVVWGTYHQTTKVHRAKVANPAKNPVDYRGNTQDMTTAHRTFNLIGVVLPLLGVLIMYVICGFGVTVGFHRMLTHRSFATYKPVQYLFAILGSMAVQGPVIAWVADHRKHHAHTDVEGDPHSPHGHGSGFKGAAKGLWYAHMGWLFDRQGEASYRKYARDLVEDAGFRRINKLFPLWVALGIALPAALGYAIEGTLAAALTGALWGGLVRVFLLHHVTWSINSVCHFFGTRRFAIDDRSTNVFWLSLLSFGESWHHNHHAFPRSAVHGLRCWELDPTAWVIRAMKRLKLAWNVVEIT